MKMSNSPQDVYLGILHIDILSREPPEAKIVQATHSNESFQIIDWKLFQIPVYFSVADAFEVKFMAQTGKDSRSDTTVILFKKNESSEKLTVSFDNIKLITFEIECVWTPIEIGTERSTSLSGSQQVFVLPKKS